MAYAAANEVLNKLAQAASASAAGVPGVEHELGAVGRWNGHATVRRIFENEGVGLIPLEAGADYLVREMSTPAGGPVEIVILGAWWEN